MAYNWSRSTGKKKEPEMPQSPSLELRSKQTQSMRQMQRMIMSPQMQQAISILQMPILELSNRIDAEIAENPLLENSEDESYDDSSLDVSDLSQEIHEEPQEGQEVTPEQELHFDDRNFEILKRIDEEFRDYVSESGNYSSKRTSEEEKLKTFMDNSFCVETTLFEHLMAQARETFASSDELDMAEAIIGNFTSSGFLEESLEEIAILNNFDRAKLAVILEGIQQFDPAGVGARNLQESLLLQLERQNKRDSLAYRMVSECYEELLYKRIPQMQKTLGCSNDEIGEAIEHEIAKLELHPGANFSYTHAFPIVPDVTLYQEGDELKIAINDEVLPQMRFNRRYLNMLEDPMLPLETRDFIKQKIISTRWFLQTIQQRNGTVERISMSLAKRQRAFFTNPEGKLTPLTMKMLAEELDLHESTIARAVANKYIYSPRGLLPLRYFFSNAYLTSEGEDLSSETVREKLSKLIKGENKKKPLSDEELSGLLSSEGIPCARRTIAKYRAALNLGNAHQRKKLS